MATDKPRFSVTFTDDSFRKIQKYKEENNISTQSKAVARLVELAIGEIESEKSAKNSPSTAEAALGGRKAPLYSSEAMTLAADYDCLDSHGKRVVRLVTDEEKARCEELMAADRRFMIQAAARSGGVTEIDKITPDEVAGSENVPL